MVVYNADSRDVLPGLGKFELLLTDPPYSTSRNQGEYRGTGNIAICLHLASQKVRRALIFSGSSNRSMEFVRSCVRRPEHNRILCWHNAGSQCQAVGPWPWDLVLIHYFGKAFETTVEGLSALICTSASETVRAKQFGHPGSVPLSVMENLYRGFAPCTVLDPFLGSGSSLLAVKRLGGSGVGIEIVERYCEIAAQRLEQESDGVAKSQITNHKSQIRPEGA